MEGTTCVRVRFSKIYRFANEETRREWNSQYDTFKRENKRDVFQDFWCTLEIAGFKERLAHVSYPGAKPLCYSQGWYYLALLLMYHGFYDAWVENAVAKKTFEIVKHVSI